jgi:hypothetical protein
MNRFISRPFAALSKGRRALSGGGEKKPNSMVSNRIDTECPARPQRPVSLLYESETPLLSAWSHSLLYCLLCDVGG